MKPTLILIQTNFYDTWRAILLVFWLGFLTSSLTCFSSLVKVTFFLWAGTFFLETETFFYHLQTLSLGVTCP